MKDFMEIPEGFMGIEIEAPFVTASENRKNTQMVIDEWNLGPEMPSWKPGENPEYWNKMAKIWQIKPEQARRQMCANCEYFDNSPMKQAKMERIPMNKWDENAGGRGFCTKFSFICHNLRTCQAWEEDD